MLCHWYQLETGNDWNLRGGCRQVTGESEPEHAVRASGSWWWWCSLGASPWWWWWGGVAGLSRGGESYYFLTSNHAHAQWNPTTILLHCFVAVLLLVVYLPSWWSSAPQIFVHMGCSCSILLLTLSVPWLLGQWKEQYLNQAGLSCSSTLPLSPITLIYINVQWVSNYKSVATCPGIISMSSVFINYVLSYVNTERIQCHIKSNILSLLLPVYIWIQCMYTFQSIY